jgi:outer membrane protein insertion porin family
MKLFKPAPKLPRWSRRLMSVAALALVSGQAFAVAPFVVSDIRVEGVQRIEPGTIFSYLPVKVGDTFTDEKGTAAIRALYATGFFKDVRVESQGNVLVISVEERPSIAGVDFTGAKEFDKTQLNKALGDIGVGEAKVYDRSAVDRAEQELKRQYLSRGFYAAQVTTTITPIERNRVNVNFTIVEGEKALIKDIRFVGNKVYSDKTLRDQIKLSTPGWFTWYTKADQYSKEKLTTDVDTLRAYYLNHGYLEMQVQSTQVSITPDKKDIYLTINVNEGDKYTVSKVDIGGETLGRQDELMSLIELKGCIFRPETD